MGKTTHRYLSHYSQHSLATGLKLDKDADGTTFRTPLDHVRFTPVKVNIDGQEVDKGLLEVDAQTEDGKKIVEFLEGNAAANKSPHPQFGRAIRRVSEAEWMDLTMSSAARKKAFEEFLQLKKSAEQHPAGKK